MALAKPDFAPTLLAHVLVHEITHILKRNQASTTRDSLNHTKISEACDRARHLEPTLR